MRIEIEFIFHAFPAALAARKVNIEQTESRMKGGNEAAFYIEERRIHAETMLETWIPQKGRHAAITKFFSRIPNDLITGKITLFLFKLFGADLDLLQAQHIRLLFPHPLQRVLAQHGAQSVDVPCYYLHSDYFIRRTAPLVHRFACPQDPRQKHAGL